MHIVVCAKQVPDTGRVEINEETGSLIRDDVRDVHGFAGPDGCRQDAGMAHHIAIGKVEHDQIIMIEIGRASCRERV